MDFIFDFDGTLLNTKDCMIDALKDTFKSHHIQDINKISLNRFVEEPNLIFTIDKIHDLSDQDLSDFLDVYRKKYLYCRKVKADLLPHVFDTLQDLKKNGSKLFLVSNSNTFDTLQKLKRLKIEHLIDGLVASDTLQVFKPHRHVIEYLIDEYKLNEDLIYMVGDSPNDIRMAHASGVKSCAVLSGISSKEALQIEAPTKILGDFSELKSLL